MFRFATLIVAASLAAAPAYAGKKVKDPCKGVKAEQDAFAITRSFEKGDLKIKQVGEAWSMQLGFNAGGGYGAFTATTTNVLAEGTVVEVMLDDGSTMSVKSSAQVGPTNVYIMGVSVTHYDVPITLSDEEAKMLAAQPIKAFRVMKGAEAFHSGEANKGDAKKFMEAVACMTTQSP